MIPYRTRRVLRHLLIAALAVLLGVTVLSVCWMLWLGRYIIYTSDGAKLDFDLPLNFSQGVAPEKPGPAPTVDIHFNEGNNSQISTELVRYSGYYVTAQELAQDFDAAAQQLLSMPAGTVISLPVRDVKGQFYYSTGLGRQDSGISTEKMDGLIAELKARGQYLIARLPAFQDYYYFLDNERERVPHGLPKDGGGGALWLDKQFGCYWLSPASDGCLAYLISQITELRSLGFREVLLEDFRYPNTDMVIFPKEKEAALDSAAAMLVKTCATDSFTVSFGLRQPGLTLPEGRTRVYLSNVAAADAAVMAGQFSLENPSIQVGFLTELHDTRFDNYCVLRPLAAARE